MDNNILNHYSEELQYLSQLFEEFAAAHPTIASELHINGHHTEDPHVSRLIQAFALISAQIKQLLNDNFSELSATLLDLLYPHYLAPFPSCAILHFKPERDLTSAKTIAAGRCVEVRSQQDNRLCHFTTIYDTKLLPIELTTAKLTAASKETGHVSEKPGGRSMLKLVLETFDTGVHFNQLEFSKIRFFIKAPKISAYHLYDLLFCHALELVGCIENEKVFQVPCEKILQSLGFNRNESMLAYSDRSSLAYSLLTEFFVFPEKFLFFDIYFNETMKQVLASPKINLYIIFNKREEQLEPYLNKNYLSLHCSPIINLFKKTAEPIILDYTRSEYQIVPDLDLTNKIEAYQVLNVTLRDSENNHYDCLPFFSSAYYNKQQQQQYFWKLQRRTFSMADGSQQGKSYISLVDTDLKNTSPTNSVLMLDLLCTNGDLPRQLASYGDKMHLQFQSGTMPIENIELVSIFTAKKQWPIQKENYWRLISHLNLNQRSLFDNHAQCEVLRQVLHLYDFMDEEGTRQLIGAIKEITCEKKLIRDPAGTLNAFIQGQQIKLFIAWAAIANHSLFLFGSILDYFFSLNCALNSFTQLEICDEQRKVLHIWPPRSGAKPVL